MQFSRHFLYNVIDIFVQDYFALVENEEILNKRASNKKRFFPFTSQNITLSVIIDFHYCSIVVHY